LPALVAQAGPSLQRLIYDASQISPLGDPAWVASLRGPDPSRPALNMGSMDASAPVAGVGEKDRLSDSTFRRGDATVRNGQVLNNGRVFLIGAERSTLGKAGSILLAPGRAAELGDLRVPFVRVYVAAPTGNALDLDRLVSQRPAIGMFNALFTPVPVRRGDSGATAIAAVPVTERSVALLPIPPAQVEDRVLTAYAAPVEERSGNLTLIPPALVEDRSFIAFIVPVKERSALLAAIPPASVEDRSFAAFAAPVEEKRIASRALVPAPIEERTPVQIARVEMKQMPAVEIGKPVPGAAIEAALVAAKKIPTPKAGLVQVALSTPVVVVAVREGAVVPVSGDPAAAPVRLAAVQKRLPSIMIDRKGAFFFM